MSELGTHNAAFLQGSQSKDAKGHDPKVCTFCQSLYTPENVLALIERCEGDLDYLIYLVEKGKL